MNHALGLAIESLVAVLLVLTIGYCMLLNKRLVRLRADEQSLKATIAELITATEIAERAIGGLKLTVRECDENLGSKLAAASDLQQRLTQYLRQGEDVVRRLGKIVVAARPADEPLAPSQRPTNAKAIAAAAEAFADRRRSHGIAA